MKLYLVRTPEKDPDAEIKEFHDKEIQEFLDYPDKPIMPLDICTIGA